MSKTRKTTPEEFLHPISTYVAPLSIVVGKEAYVGGTAVIIAPGLAITAHHVIEGMLDKFGFDSSSSDLELDVYLVQMQTGACWYVCNTSMWKGTDISVLSLMPRNEEATNFKIIPLQMTVDPPLSGSTVTAIGYPHSQLEIPRNDSVQTDLKFFVEPTLAEGGVLEIHNSYRDSANLRFPCFSVNAEFRAGMSGGAVFNNQRELCGLVCYGGKGDLEDHSYAVSIWPMSNIPVNIPKHAPACGEIEPGKTYKIHELAKNDFIVLKGHKRIEFFKHDNGTDGVRRHHAPRE